MVGAEETPGMPELLDIWGRSHARYLAGRELLWHTGLSRTPGGLPLLGHGFAGGHRELAGCSQGSHHDQGRELQTKQVASSDSRSVLVTCGVHLPDGNGAWAFKLTPGGDGRPITRSRASKTKSRNRIEMRAVLAGLHAMTAEGEVLIITSSQYVVDGIHQIIDGPASKSEHLFDFTNANRDLWCQLGAEIENHRVTVQTFIGPGSPGSGRSMNRKEKCLNQV